MLFTVSTFDISQPNTTRYWASPSNDYYRIMLVRLWRYKNILIVSLMGDLWDIFLEYFRLKWPWAWVQFQSGTMWSYRHIFETHNYEVFSYTCWVDSSRPGDVYIRQWNQGSSVYAPSQWETTLHCNVVSHWLGTNTIGFSVWQATRHYQTNDDYRKKSMEIWIKKQYYSDVIMSAMASQITYISISIVCSTACLGVDQRKHQRSASLAFVRGIHRYPLNSLHKGQVTRKMFPFDDVIMKKKCIWKCRLQNVKHFIRVSVCPNVNQFRVTRL